MFRLSRKVEFCLMILKHFNTKKELSALGLSDPSSPSLSNSLTIANKYKISATLTQKMLQKLKQKKILSSIQGIKGGYQLIKDLKAISFLELIETIEGPVNTVRCINKKNSSCNYYDGCEIVDPMRNFNMKLREFYSNIFLDELINLSFKKKTKKTKKQEEKLHGN